MHACGPLVDILVDILVYRSAANDDNEAAELLMAAGWIDWDAAAGAAS